MKKVLFVCLKWTDARPGRPLSSAFIFINTLIKSGLGTPLMFFCDEHIHMHRTACDEAFVRMCAQERPDMLFLFPTQLDIEANLNVDSRGMQKFFLFPRNETLRWVRNRLGIPIVNAVGDAYGMDAFKRFDDMTDFSDKLLLFDPESDFLKLTTTPEKYATLWCPVPQDLYCSNGQQRDIGISFIGRTYPAKEGETLPPENPLHQYAYRELFLQKMISEGVPVFRAGGAQNMFPLGAEMVAQYFQRSKISLNLTYQSPAKRLMRGRSWEALNCGAMLLEEANPSIPHYLEPMKQYVPFSGMADAIEKSRFFLRNDSERTAIAEAGYRIARGRYNASVFWSECFKLIYC
jgi:hypothetical protein